MGLTYGIHFRMEARRSDLKHRPFNDLYVRPRILSRAQGIDRFGSLPLVCVVCERRSVGTISTPHRFVKVRESSALPVPCRLKGPKGVLLCQEQRRSREIRSFAPWRVCNRIAPPFDLRLVRQQFVPPDTRLDTAACAQVCGGVQIRVRGCAAGPPRPFPVVETQARAAPLPAIQRLTPATSSSRKSPSTKLLFTDP